MTAANAHAELAQQMLKHLRALPYLHEKSRIVSIALVLREMGSTPLVHLDYMDHEGHAIILNLGGRLFTCVGEEREGFYRPPPGDITEALREQRPEECEEARHSLLAFLARQENESLEQLVPGAGHRRSVRL